MLHLAYACDLSTASHVGAPHPLGELRGLLAEVASGWGRSGRGSGAQYSRWAPNMAVARRIWLPGASIMEDYYVPRAHVCAAVLGLSVPKCPGN